MSLSTRIRNIQNIVSELKKWPDDSHKAYISFRNNQLEKFEDSTKGSSSKLTVNLEGQAEAFKKLGEDVNKDKV